MPTFTFRLLEEDILQGEKRSPTKCPVALSVKRQLPYCWIRVNKAMIWIRKKETVGALLPLQIREFVSLFDIGGCPNLGYPFPFTLNFRKWNRFVHEDPYIARDFHK